MNYTDLKNATIAYADRYSDAEVDSNFNTMLLMVEARINRLVRHGSMAVRATVPTVAGQQYYALPTGFLAMRDLQIATPNGQVTLAYISPALGNPITSDDYDYPSFYTIIDGQIQLYPTPGDVMSMEAVFYRTITGLSTTATTNWLSTLYPDIYLSGLQFEVSAFVKDKAAADLWNARFEILIAELTNSDLSDRWSGTPLITQVVQ